MRTWDICPLSASCITLIFSISPFNFFPVAFLDLQGQFLVFLCPYINLFLSSTLSPAIERTNEYSTLCIFLIFNPGLFKSAVCSQGSQFSSLLLLTELLFLSLSGITCAIRQPSPPLHTLKSKWKLGCFVLIPHLCQWQGQWDWVHP